MIHLISFFWRRIFPLILVALGVVMAFRDNYLAVGGCLVLAMIFWKLGGTLMTGLWHKWMKISLWVFWLVFVTLIAVGYYLYAVR